MNRIEKIQKIKKMLNEYSNTNGLLEQSPQIIFQVIDTGFPIKESEDKENE